MSEEKAKIPYLTYKEFMKKYPLGEKLSEGGYGKVFESGKSNVVKSFDEDISFTELVKEVNAYNMFDHPCIVKPLAWSYKDNVGYLAIPRGKDITQAYEEGDISLKRIIFDTLSAISYLNVNGFAYRDIKPPNILYFEEENICKFVDMGSVVPAKLNGDGNYYIRGPAYTLGYVDPEYDESRWNNISCEIYALIISWMTIVGDLQRNREMFGAIYNYQSKHKELSWLVRRAVTPIKDRPKIEDILIDASSRFELKMYKENTKKILLPESITCFNYPDDSISLIKLAMNIYGQTQSEVLFLALSIYNRTMKSIAKLYEDEENYIEIFGTACLDIASSLTTGYREDMYEMWKNTNYVDNDKDKFYSNMMIKILEETNGHVYSMTCWNYAKRAEDLLTILKQMINCQEIESSPEGNNSNKFIPIRNIIPDDEDYSPSDEKGENLAKINQPCNLYTDPSIKRVISAWNEEELNMEECVAVLLYNRDALHELDLGLSLKIFRNLIGLPNNRPVFDHTLDMISHFDWRKYQDKVLKKNLHPFTVTDKELNR